MFSNLYVNETNAGMDNLITVLPHAQIPCLPHISHLEGLSRCIAEVILLFMMLVYRFLLQPPSLVPCQSWDRLGFGHWCGFCWAQKQRFWQLADVWFDDIHISPGHRIKVYRTLYNNFQDVCGNEVFFPMCTWNKNQTNVFRLSIVELSAAAFWQGTHVQFRDRSSELGSTLLPVEKWSTHSSFFSFFFQQVSMLAWGCVNVFSSFKAILSCESASSRWTWSQRLFCAWWEGNGNCGAFKFRHWNIFTIDVHKEKCPSFFLHIAFPLLLNDNSTRQFCGVYHSLAADIKGHARWRAQCQSLVDSFGICTIQYTSSD